MATTALTTLVSLSPCLNNAPNACVPVTVTACRDYRAEPVLQESRNAPAFRHHQCLRRRGR